MGISATGLPGNDVTTDELSLLRHEVALLRARLETVQVENGSLTMQLQRANKVIKVLSDRSAWFENLLVHVAADDGAPAKYN